MVQPSVHKFTHASGQLRQRKPQTPPLVGVCPNRATISRLGRHSPKVQRLGRTWFFSLPTRLCRPPTRPQHAAKKHAPHTARQCFHPKSTSQSAASFLPLPGVLYVHYVVTWSGRRRDPERREKWVLGCSGVQSSKPGPGKPSHPLLLSCGEFENLEGGGLFFRLCC